MAKKDKQRFTKPTHNIKDWVTWTPLKTGSELRCSVTIKIYFVLPFFKKKLRFYRKRHVSPTPKLINKKNNEVDKICFNSNWHMKPKNELKKNTILERFQSDTAVYMAECRMVWWQHGRPRNSILPFWCVFYIRQAIKTAACDLVLHGIVSQSNRPSIINGKLR